MRKAPKYFEKTTLCDVFQLDRFKRYHGLKYWRARSKNKEHRELWIVSSYLLAEQDTLTFPITITHRDAPDFDVTFGDGCTESIEVTMAVGENLAKARKIARSEIAIDVYSPDIFRPETVRSPSKALKDQLKNSFSGPPFLGDEVERVGAKLLAERIAEKLEKGRNYDVLPITLVVDFDHPLPNIDSRSLLRYALQYPKVREAASVFSSISVLLNGNMYRIPDE